MPGRALVICGHPRRDSFGEALAQAYAQGARSVGVDCHQLMLSDLRFDPDVHTPSPRQQPLEPDLQRALAALEAADHLVFVYPAWWGVGPARMKGFLDRVLLPGRAFEERPDGGFEGLMRGRTAHLLTTLDMPPWVYRWIHRAPGHVAMKRSTLGFCGIRTLRTLALGPVKASDDAQRMRWLADARAMGASLRQGPAGPVRRLLARPLAWLTALRLQFHAVPLLSFTAAVLAAIHDGGDITTGLFVIGYLAIFFAEAATVFTNDRFDFASDQLNTNYGAFTGGSRVMVQGRLDETALANATLACTVAALACAAIVLHLSTPAVDTVAAAIVFGLTLMLGIGYTRPPWRLSWRGLGEGTVAITHGFGVVLWGWLLAGGPIDDPLPWLFGLPLALGILPAIAISAIPDMDADAAAGKRTLAVRYGAGGALLFALAATLLAIAAGVLLPQTASVAGAYAGLAVFVVPHGALLSAMIVREIRRGDGARKLDPLMLAALGFIAWFAIVPVWNLW